VISQVLVLEKKTLITGVIWSIAALFNVGLTWILVQQIGIVGAATATLLSFGFSFLVTAYCAMRYLCFDFDYYFVLKSILASIVMSIFLIWLSPEGTVNLLLSVLIAALIYFVVLFALRGLDEQEIKFFRDLLKN
jgi:O-antigen/teichoic acid export membrane protein